MSKINWLEKQVLEILDKCPDTRNSDKLLAWKLWEEFYDVTGDSITLAEFMKLPSQANIQRIRAKIQNKDGQYLPTNDKVIARRNINMIVWKETLGY